MDDEKTYPIGDVARRTGLSVSAIRFYADTGVVEPSAHTSAGYRRYDVEAIARLELVRTLRDLGAGLEDIRRLLAGQTTVHELATAHLAVLEQEASRLRTRRAVLRALVRQRGSAERVALLHRVVSLSDEERERLIEEFWAEVSDGLNENPRFVADLNSAPPRLPDEPTLEQLDAWIELASLVSDPEVRRAVRADLNGRFSDGVGQLLVSPTALESYERGTPLLMDAVAAQRAGLAPDSPRAQELADRYLRWLGEMFGASFEDAATRREIAESLLLLEPEVLADLEREAHGPPATDPHERYQHLVQVINGTLKANHAELAGYAAAYTWIAVALNPTAAPTPD
ncbi:MerR family transcriptional regulator [Streptomyces hainanensis]|uniref:MerR family transcriptional regulator n=1 Tax=Streptomyces hainanensis TaxID=402648 RepID=A0A4R4SFF7_9ACTN|nr:MerR family transcriptional regulator [Streptomyces hainanensis]TDC62128.1 MerR family transcriptional regulator [Streptomyces hainanensis]